MPPSAPFAAQRKVCYISYMFYFAVAEVTRSRTTPTEDPVEISLDFDFDVNHHASLHDLYTSDVEGLVAGCGWSLSKIPSQFMVVLLSWIFEHSEDGSDVYPISYIELVLGFASSQNARFPFWDSTTGSFELQLLSTRFERPTLSQLLSLVRSACLHFVRGCDCVDASFCKRNKVSLGVIRPIGGLFVRLRSDMIQHCQSLTTEFFRSRQYRRACDLARPI